MSESGPLIEPATLSTAPATSELIKKPPKSVMGTARIPKILLPSGGFDRNDSQGFPFPSRATAVCRLRTIDIGSHVPEVENASKD